MMRVCIVSSVAAVVVAAATGCSSHSSASSFRDKANAICARASARVRALDALDARRPLGVATETRRALGVQRRALANLRSLKPPADQAALFAALLATYGKLNRQTERVIRWNARYGRAATAALAKAPKPRHFTQAELAHPTAAILDRAMTVPAFRRYIVGLERLAARSLPAVRRAERLARRLGLDRCAR
jgi:hypothetical protein